MVPSDSQENGKVKKDDDRNHHERFDLIHSYTRQQAIEDGVLVDLTETAFSAYVEAPADVPGQDAAGRLWDILWML